MMQLLVTTMMIAVLKLLYLSAGCEFQIQKLSIFKRTLDWSRFHNLHLITLLSIQIDLDRGKKFCMSRTCDLLEDSIIGSITVDM